MQTASTLPVSQIPANRFNDTPVMSVEDFCDLMSAQERAATAVETAPVVPVTSRPSTFVTGPTNEAEEAAYFADSLTAFRKMAKAMNADRMATAEAEHAFYEQVYTAGDFGDGFPRMVRIQQAGNKANPRYTVERGLATCDCPDFKDRVEPLRRQMTGTGATDTEARQVCCKHCFMVEEKIKAGTVEPLLANPNPVVVQGAAYNGHHVATALAIANFSTAANTPGKMVSRQEQINRDFC